MGCDIHLYSETKKNGIWVADKANTFNPHEDADPDPDGDAGYPVISTSYDHGRNYWLFGLLNSNVRTYWPWSFEEQGFPEDASPEIATVYAHWDTDAHSASHLTVQQLKEKATDLLVHADPDANTHASYLVSLINGLPPCDHQEQRIVFWFDN